LAKRRRLLPETNTTGQGRGTAVSSITCRTGVVVSVDLVDATFVTEIGAPTISEDEARELHRELLEESGALKGRAHAASHAIQAALLSDRKVELEHAERLALIDVLNRRPRPLEPELIALEGALRQAPSLRSKFGRNAEGLVARRAGKSASCDGKKSAT
jgi:hypothetical protein